MNLFLVVLLFLVLLPSSFEQDEEGFCYDDSKNCGPSHWPGICQTGNSQSPIDLTKLPESGKIQAINLIKPETVEINNIYKPGTSTNTVLQFSGYAGNKFTLENNGDTIRMKFCPRSTMNEYTFDQLHFHWGETKNVGSEHTLNSKRYGGEMHLVHYKTTCSTFECALESDDSSAISVLGYFLEVKRNNPDNAVLYDILTNFPTEVNKIPKKINKAFNLTPIIPKPGDYYYGYYGSLTTPTCDEKVLWRVVEKPIQISVRDWKAFHTVLGHDNNTLVANYRALQALNGRVVTYYRVQ